jgi:glycosyltransferase involved in cell wall biosynthesis
MDKKISIVITVLESYMIVKRQIKYFKSLNLPDSIEIIFMDDGSDPPIKDKVRTYGLKNFNIYPTGDKRPWSQACARNLGARIAEGEFLLMTDIDHIITKEIIESVENFDGDKMTFTRAFGVLDKFGRIDQRPKTLFKYGLNKTRYKRKGLFKIRHVNSFAIRRNIYFELGGYPEKYCNRPKGGNKGDKSFYQHFRRRSREGMYKEEVIGPQILTYPGLPKDPLKIFHTLKRYPKGHPMR